MPDAMDVPTSSRARLSQPGLSLSANGAPRRCI